jgi:hypothetical protein
MGRNKKGQPSKHYFAEREEEAVRIYTDPASSQSEKHRVFNTILDKPLRKMSAILVRKYCRWVGQAGIDEVEELTYLAIYEAMNNGNYKHSKIDEDGNVVPRKAYSYLGTIGRNFASTYGKKANKFETAHEQFEPKIDEFESDERFKEDASIGTEAWIYDNIFEDIVSAIKDEINNNAGLKPNDIKVGHALIMIFESWKFIEEDDIQQKVTKFYLKKKIAKNINDLTNLSTKDITRSMKLFKGMYKGILKSKILID